MQAITLNGLQQYEPMPPNAGYVKKALDQTTLGQPTTSYHQTPTVH